MNHTVTILMTQFVTHKELAYKHCQRRVVSTLEGGYELHVLGRCATAHVKVLTGL